MTNLFTSRARAWAGLALLAALSACTAKEDVAPEQVGCATTATVRLCPGRTTACATEHTTLELADGTRLQPSGPAWQAYQPQQADGQLLRIGYTLRPQLMTTEANTKNAEISCLTLVGNWCGTPPRGNN